MFCELAKLLLTWLDRISMIKMKVLIQVLFLVLHMNLGITKNLIMRIQAAINFHLQLQTSMD